MTNKQLENLIGVGCGLVLGNLLGLVILAFVVKLAWNAVMPSLFQLNPITFWQALALQVLVHVLFAVFRKKK